MGSQGKRGLWKGQFPPALFSEPAAPAGCQGEFGIAGDAAELSQQGYLSVRDDNNSDLPDSSLSHLPPASLFPNCFSLPWIYLLWKLLTSGRSFPPLIPGEHCTDPCLASTTPLPKPHPHCLFHSTKCCCAMFSTGWSFLQKQLHFLHDTKKPLHSQLEFMFLGVQDGIQAAPVTVSSLMTWLL